MCNVHIGLRLMINFTGMSFIAESVELLMFGVLIILNNKLRLMLHNHVRRVEEEELRLEELKKEYLIL